MSLAGSQAEKGAAFAALHAGEPFLIPNPWDAGSALVDRGIQHVHIKPATPRLNGKVERSHRIDADEFYQMLSGVVIDDAKVFNQKLQEWENFYNYNRPHGSLGGQTPYERLRQKTEA